MSLYNGKNYDENADKMVIGGTFQIADGGQVVDKDGNPVSLGGSSYTLPAATTSALGGVKQSAVTAQVAAADAANAAGDTPTKDEFNAVVALANELKAKLNSVINNDRASGQAASK
jgi:glutaminase